MKLDPTQVAAVAGGVGKIEEFVGLPEPAALIHPELKQLESAFSQIKEDAASMIGRMSRLEPNDPGLGRLESLLEELLPGIGQAGLGQIVEKAHQDYADAKSSIDEIDSIAATAEFMAAVCAALALAPEGITTPMAIGLALKGGKGLYDLLNRLQEANVRTEVILELASKLAETRGVFDRLWDQIDNEDSRLENQPEETDWLGHDA